MILSQEQLFELTRKKRSSSQADVLNSMGIEHRLRPDGSVVVSQLHLEQVLGVVVTSQSNKIKEPNWGMVNA